MSGVIVGLSLILYSYVYNIVISVFAISKSLATFTVYYCLAGFSINIGCAYFFANTMSKGELLIIPVCIVGAVVRIGTYYFRKQHKMITS